MAAQTTELLPNHFSHDHPLEHTNSFAQTNTTCFGCNLTIIPGHYYYKCKTCCFYLHQVCHNMPKKVQHPCDPNHQLTLKSMPNNVPSKLDVKCKACEHNLSGFYYSCNKCDDYYHILCSAVPLSVKTPSHQHILKLEYEPPYDFQCDLCHKPCYTGWLYRCSICEFDVHLACAITNKGAQLLHHQMVPKSPRPTSINKKQELMELLTRGLTKGEEKMEEETHEMPEEDQQITSPPEDPSFISYQFSDACFSIDFAKSLLGCEDHSQPFSGLAQVKEAESPRNSTQNGNVFIVDQHKQKKQQSDVSTKSEPTPSPLHRSSLNGLKISVSGGIGSHIWVEIDPETEKSNGLGTGFRDKSVKARDLGPRKSRLDGVSLSGNRKSCCLWCDQDGGVHVGQGD